jgi:1,4-alpha-glucan branching enzyme
MPTTRNGIDAGTPLGATVTPAGVTIRVWAPAARQVFLLTTSALAASQRPGFTPSADDALFPLGDGTWGALVAGGEGTRYRLWVVGSAGAGLKRDPRARELGTDLEYPNCDCIARSPATYPWHDAGFRPPDFRDLVIYQLHVGVFYAVDELGRDRRRSIGRFLDLLDRVTYLRDLGVNAVQLLPIQDFPTETSLGYNGLDLFSPEMEYQVDGDAALGRYLATANALLASRGQPGLRLDDLRPGPNQLKCVVDLLHVHGIAVIFDLVFNHAGPGFDDQSLWFLDRQTNGDNNRSLYFTDHQWAGGRVFAYWRREVREFLRDNALAMLDEYHVDGIRYDEVSVMVNNGGAEFARELTPVVRSRKPAALQLAEYWNDDRATPVLAPPVGLGFDAGLSDRLRLGVRAALAQARGGRDAWVDVEALGRALDTPGGFPDAWRIVNGLENHDLVFVDREPRLPALADPSDARSWYARSRTRVATGILLAARGIPMFFMGQEILEDKPWSDDVHRRPDLLIWWDGLTADRAMQDHLQFCRDLLQLRHALPALRSESLRVSVSSSLDRVLAIHRWVEWEGRDVLLVANLQEFTRDGYRIGFPQAGRWRELFNSDYYESFPNPSPAGNGGGVEADGPAWDGMPASATVTIPANGFIVFGC